MSCRKEGDRDENQRPELIASRSSMVRIGSSMVCLVSDWRALPLSPPGPGARLRVVTCAPCVPLFVVRRLPRQEGRDPGAAIGVMEVAHEVIALAGELPLQRRVVRLVHQLL